MRGAKHSTIPFLQAIVSFTDNRFKSLDFKSGFRHKSIMIIRKRKIIFGTSIKLVFFFAGGGGGGGS